MEKTVNIDKLKPGPETDRLVAEAIGNTYSCDDDPPEAIDFLIYIEGEMILHKIQPDRSYLAEEFLPSRDLNAAFWAAERFRLFESLRHDCYLSKAGSLVLEWFVHRGDKDFHGVAHDPKPAMAICKAILKLKAEE